MYLDLGCDTDCKYNQVLILHWEMICCGWAVPLWLWFTCTTATCAGSTSTAELLLEPAPVLPHSRSCAGATLVPHDVPVELGMQRHLAGVSFGKTVLLA